MKTNTLSEEINEEFDSQNPTIIVRGVWNHHSYTVGHATTISWNSSVVHFLQLCIVFTVSVVFLHWLYIYLFIYVLYSIHLWLILQVGFSAKWMWSDPSPSMQYSTQSIHKFFMCVLFETRSKSSLCPCQLNNLRTELLTYLIQIFGFTAQTVPHPTKYLSIHPRSNTISTSKYVGDTCHANEMGQEHVRPNSSGE